MNNPVDSHLLITQRVHYGILASSHISHSEYNTRKSWGQIQ